MKLYCKRFSSSEISFIWNVNDTSQTCKVQTIISGKLLGHFPRIKIDKGWLEASIDKGWLEDFSEISLDEAIDLGFDPSYLTPKEIVQIRLHKEKGRPKSLPL